MRFIGRFLAAVAIGSLAAHLWLAADVAAFRREVAANPMVPHARARVAPFGSGGLTYQPGRGIAAHD